MRTLRANYDYMQQQYEVGNYGRVIANADKLLRGFEREFHLKAYILKGYAHYFQNEGIEALEAFTTGLQHYPESTELRYGRASTLLVIGNYAASVAELIPLHESYPEDTELLENLLSALNALERYPEVLNYGTKLLALEPDSFSFHGIIGDAHRELGNYSESIRYFEAALALEGISDEVKSDGYDSLAHTYLEKGDLQEAKKHFEQSLLHDKSPLSYSSLGITLARLGQIKEGLDMVNYALGLDAYNGFSYFHRAKIRLQQQKPDRAVKDLLKAKRLGLGTKDEVEANRLLSTYQ